MLAPRGARRHLEAHWRGAGPAHLGQVGRQIGAEVLDDRRGLLAERVHGADAAHCRKDRVPPPLVEAVVQHDVRRVTLGAHPDEDGFHAAAGRRVLRQRGHHLVARELRGEVRRFVQDEVLPLPRARQGDRAPHALPAGRLRPHLVRAALQRGKDVRAQFVREHRRRDRPPRRLRRDRDPFQRFAGRRGHGSRQQRVLLLRRRDARRRPAVRTVGRRRGGAVERDEVGQERVDLRRTQRVLPARHAGGVAFLDHPARVVSVARRARAVQPARIRRVAATEDREMADGALLLEDARARCLRIRQRGRGGNPGRLRVEAGLGYGKQRGEEQDHLTHAQSYTPCRPEWEPVIARCSGRACLIPGRWPGAARSLWAARRLLMPALHRLAHDVVRPRRQLQPAPRGCCGRVRLRRHRSRNDCSPAFPTPRGLTGA